MNEKNNLIIRWIQKADHDLGTAILVKNHNPEYRDTIAFHCQQAVEKYLKAVLIKLNISFSKTHDLVFLLELINENENIEKLLFEKALELQDYEVEIRYPDETIELSENDIRSAIKIAQEFREWIISRLDLNIDFNEFLGS